MTLSICAFYQTTAQTTFASVNGSNSIETNQVYAKASSIIALEIESIAGDWEWRGPANYSNQGNSVYVTNFAENKSGRYYATRGYGNDKQSVSFDLNFLEENFAAFDSDIMVCGEQDVLITAVPNHHYQWSTSATTQSISVNTGVDASYTVTVTTDFGDVDVATVYVIDNEGQDIVENIYGFTCGTELPISAPNGYATYLWDDGHTGQSSSFNVFNPTMRTVTLTTENGCETRYHYVFNPIVNLEPLDFEYTIQAPMPCAQEVMVDFRLKNEMDYYFPITAKLYNELGLAYQIEITGPTQSVMLNADTYTQVEVTTADGCNIVFDGFNLVAGGGNEVFNMRTRTVCEGDVFTLNAPSGYELFFWDNGSTESSIEMVGLQSTDIVLQMADINGCTSEAIFPIEVIPALDIDFTTDNATSQTPGALNLMLDNTGSDIFPVSVYADTEAGSETLIAVTYSYFTEIPLLQGSYQNLTVFNASGCPFDLGDFEIGFTPSFTEEYMPEMTYCKGEKIEVTAPEGFESYMWYNSTRFQELIIFAEANTQFFVDATDANGDVTRFIYTALVIDTPDAELNVNLREGFVLGSIDLNLTNSSFDMFPIEVRVNSNGEEIFLDEMNSDFTNIQLADGEYFGLTLTTAAGCLIELGDFVMEEAFSYEEVTMPLTSVCEGETVQLEAPSGSSSYIWSDGTVGRFLTITPTESKTYSVLATALNGDQVNYFFPVDFVYKAIGTLEATNSAGNNSGYVSIELTQFSQVNFPIEVLVVNGESTNVIGQITEPYSVFELEDGIYTNLTIITQQGCAHLLGDFEISRDQVIENVNMEASLVCVGESLQLEAPSGANTYLWNDGTEGRFLNVIPLVSETMSVQATQENGDVTNYFFPIEVAMSAQGNFDVTLRSENVSGSILINLTQFDNSIFPIDVWVTSDQSGQIMIGQMQSQELSIDLADGIYSDLTLLTSQGCAEVLGDFEIFEDRVTQQVVMPMTRVCEGSSVQLMAPDNLQNYLWGDGTEGRSFAASPTDDVDYIVTADNGTVFYTYIFPVELKRLPETSFVVSYDELLEEGEVNVTLNNTEQEMFPVDMIVTSQLGSQQVVRMTSNTATVDGLGLGLYSLSIVTAEACFEVVSNFEVELPEAQYEEVQMPTTYICEGELVILSVPGALVNHVWDDGTIGRDYVNAPDQNVVYTVTANDNDGQLYKYFYPVEVYELPEATYETTFDEVLQEGTLDIDLNNSSNEIFPVTLNILNFENELVEQHIMNSSNLSLRLDVGDYALELVTVEGCQSLFGAFQFLPASSQNLRLHSVEGQVWLDNGFDRGIIESDEKGFAGVEVSAINMEGKLVATATTNDEGMYEMLLPDDSYYFEFRSEDSYLETASNVGVNDDIDSDIDGSYGPGTTEMYDLSQVTSSKISGGYILGVLPIEWKSIAVRSISNSNELTWEVADETNVSHYEIERAINQTDNFVKVGQVSFNDNGLITNAYNYTDIDLDDSGIYYYRVKQLDIDGDFEYSKIVSTDVNLKHQDSDVRNAISLYPNPAADASAVNIKVLNDISILSIDVYSAEGQLVKSNLVSDSDIAANQTKTYNLNIEELEEGNYIIILTIDNDIISKKLMKL